MRISAAPFANEAWVNVTGNLAYKPSECGNLTLVSPVPSSQALIAGVAGRAFWVGTDGKTWARLTKTTTASDTISNRPSALVFDPTDPNVFWESGIYGELADGGIYKTTDGGKTFRRLGNIRHNDHVSVDFSDPERQTLLAGGHEQAQTVHLSTDGGKTWTNVGGGIPATAGQTTHPLALNAYTFLVNATGNGPGGIFKSENAGQTWRRVSNVGPAGAPLRTSNGTILWMTTGRALRSTDAGSTWTASGDGLLAVTPVELPDRKLVAVGESSLVISSDGGGTWQPVGPDLPYAPQGLAYSAERKSFLIWRGNCSDHVPPDAIMELKLGDS
jgi:photosystem II stability/assembly factor-like uncharacterized protein